MHITCTVQRDTGQDRARGHKTEASKGPEGLMVFKLSVGTWGGVVEKFELWPPRAGY